MFPGLWTLCGEYTVLDFHLGLLVVIDYDVAAGNWKGSVDDSD